MIVPFGKYRRKTYLFLLNTEPTYMDWLLRQSWFPKQYPQDYSHCVQLKNTPDIVKTNENFIVYTDGSCPCNGKKNAACGIGIHFSRKNSIHLPDISEPVHSIQGTNNLAELMAIYRAIEETKHIPNVIIYTDSKYAIDSITRWYEIWVKTKKENSKKHIELIRSIYHSYKQYQIELKHIKAHTGKLDEHSIGNMIADKLATQSIT